MDVTMEPLDPELVSTMYAVVVDRVPATEAWLGFLRARHPEAIEALAQAAMTDLALDLLVANGDLTPSEAAEQRRAASDPESEVPADVWSSIVNLKRTLETLEVYLPDEPSDILLLEEPEAIVRRAS
jgi:hypothetical protein